MTAQVQPDASDVTVLHNDLSSAPGLPLVAVARNEVAMLPDFLAHYRGIGVERFFVLDDMSDDGTRDYLRKQADVCLLGSRCRYGDKPAPDQLVPTLRDKPDLRMIHVWRTALMTRFCAREWAVQCDIDEFLCLPEGVTLPDLAARLTREGARGAWGGMIDLYPATVADLAQYPETGFTVPHQAWYYDGARHFSLRRGKPPRHHYVGVRHRLDVAFADKPDLSGWGRLKLRLKGHRKAPSGTLVKPIFQHWTPGEYYLDSHRTTLALSDKVLLPLLHYRYAPHVLKKLTWAITEGGYSKGNADYVRFDRMLGEMHRRSASFLTGISRPVAGFDDFVQTGNARY